MIPVVVVLLSIGALVLFEVIWISAIVIVFTAVWCFNTTQRLRDLL